MYYNAFFAMCPYAAPFSKYNAPTIDRATLQNFIYQNDRKIDHVK